MATFSPPTAAGPSVSTKPSPSPALAATSTKDSKGTANGASTSKSGALSRSASADKPALPILPPGTVRSSKTDGVETKHITDDKTRNKCIELVYDSLAMESVAGKSLMVISFCAVNQNTNTITCTVSPDSEIILERSREIERAAFKGLPDASAYRTKMRSLYLNLKDKKNPELRASIISGEIDGKTLWSMSVQDLASAEKKAELAALSKQALFDAQGAAPKKSETDMFQCGKCKAKRATYYQMQTRSADEVSLAYSSHIVLPHADLSSSQPMTTFVSCLACGHNWRFS
jgi:transcription elongation factor S-II